MINLTSRVFGLAFGAFVALAGTTAGATGWYVGVQQNLTGFSIDESENYVRYRTIVDAEGNTSRAVDGVGTREEKRDYKSLVSTTLFVGRDYALRDSIVAGFEGGIGLFGSTIDEVSGDGETAGIVGRATIREISNEISVRGRLGYDLSSIAGRDDSLIYGTIGYANLATGGIENGFETGSAASSFDKARDVNLSGFTYGVGVETSIFGTVNGRVEYSIGLVNRFSFGVAHRF